MLTCPICHRESVPEPVTERNRIEIDPIMDRDLEIEVKIIAFGGSVSAFINKSQTQSLIAELKKAYSL